MNKVIFFEVKGVGINLKLYFGINGVEILIFELVILVLEILSMLKWNLSFFRICVWRFFRFLFRLIILLWKMEKFDKSVFWEIFEIVCIKLWGEKYWLWIWRFDKFIRGLMFIFKFELRLNRFRLYKLVNLLRWLWVGLDVWILLLNWLCNIIRLLVKLK